MEFFKPLTSEEESHLIQEYTLKTNAIVPQCGATHSESPVFTMVCRGKIHGTRFHVPSFADHWGIVVNNTLYHLIYHWKEKRSEFTWEKWDKKDSPKVNLRKVGTTHYTHEEISSIGIHPTAVLYTSIAILTSGNAMFSVFGPYHLKVWNCQIFAKIFLKAICVEEGVEFNSLTMPDATRVVQNKQSSREFLIF
jgi:hypothetical protein